MHVSRGLPIARLVSTSALRHRLRGAVHLRRIDDQHAVDPGVLARRLDGGLEVLRARGFGQVQQIGQRSGFGHPRPQRADRFGRQPAELQADLADPVGRQHAGSAAVGDDRQPPADRTVAGREALGRRKQLDERAHAHRAGAAQRGIEHFIAADDGPAVGLRGFVARRPAAGLENDHGLGDGGRAQRAHERTRAGNALEVDDDALRAHIVREKVEHLRDVDVRAPPEGRDQGKAHGVGGRPVQHRRRQRSGLRDQREGPRLGQRPERAGIELQLRTLEAQAVRAEQVDAFATRDLLELGGLLRAHAAPEHQCRATSHAPRELERRRHVLRRQRDDGQIGLRLRQVGQRAAGVDVQEVELARKALGAQRGVQRAGVRGLACRIVRPAGEDRDRLGRQQGSEVVLVHDLEECAIARVVTRGRAAGQGLPTA